MVCINHLTAGPDYTRFFHFLWDHFWTLTHLGSQTNSMNKGGGHGAVVKAACLESRRSRVRTQLWPSSFKEMFLLRSLVKIQYCHDCGEPP